MPARAARSTLRQPPRRARVSASRRRHAADRSLPGATASAACRDAHLLGAHGQRAGRHVKADQVDDAGEQERDIHRAVLPLVDFAHHKPAVVAVQVPARAQSELGLGSGTAWMRICRHSFVHAGRRARLHARAGPGGAPARPACGALCGRPARGGRRPPRGRRGRHRRRRGGDARGAALVPAPCKAGRWRARAPPPGSHACAARRAARPARLSAQGARAGCSGRRRRAAMTSAAASLSCARTSTSSRRWCGATRPAAADWMCAVRVQGAA